MFHLIFSLLSSSIINHDYVCQPLYPFYSTKTSYESLENHSYEIKNCEAQSIWILVRNGARYPSASEISTFKSLKVVQDEILENKDKYHVGEMCNTEIETLRKWNFSVNKDQSMILAEKGFEECFLIGNRLLEYFPDIFLKNVTADINVRVTSQLSSIQSAYAFTSGLGKFPFQVIPEVYDEVLMNEKNCPAWASSTKSHQAMAEIIKMEQSDVIKKLLIDVKQRLGYTHPVPFEMVKLMYDLCGYESSWAISNRSPWCPTLKEEHLKIMEYYKDLMNYYKSGYGNPLTKKLGCSLLSDLIKWLKSDNPVPTFNFGHLLAIQKLMVSLGIAGGDKPLKGDGYYESSQREWRTSILNPFAANVMAVLYKCKKNEKMKVAFYLNEYVIQLPACSQVLCELDEFINKFSSAIDPQVCNRDFCNLRK